MRILWSSNAPWAPSGYGVQTKRIVHALKAAGHDMAIFAWWGLEGGQLHMDGVPIYQKAGHPYGADVLGQHAKHFGADIAITLIDAWVQEPSQLPPDVKWVPYFPIDSDPVSPRIVEKVRSAYDRIVFSQHACAAMDAQGLSYQYAPHVVPTDVFKPLDRRECRARVGMPQDRFIAGVVAANKGHIARKSWPQIFEAWGEFVRNTDREALLYIHSTTGEGGGDSCDLGQLARYHNVQANIIVVDQYALYLGMSEDYLIAVMNGIDVLLNPAMGEGFGVPILEAQACGCPVIVTDATAMPELCFAGWKVAMEDCYRYWISNYGAYQYMPYPSAITRCLEQARDAVPQRAELSARAVAGAAAYDTQTVMQTHWLPALARIEERVKGERSAINMVQL